MVRFLQRWGLTIAFLVLAVFVGIAINGSAHKTATEDALVVWHAQMSACERGNVLRQESNARIPAHQADKRNLILFMRAAAKARQHAGTPTDIRAAKMYRHLIRVEERTVKFNRLPLVDCRKAVPKP